MTMEINNSKISRKIDCSKTSSVSRKKYMSTQEKMDKYIKELEEEYSKLNIKVNVRNIYVKNKISITLSPELIEKAVNDSKVDKSLRKTLKELSQNRGIIKSYNCTRDGKEVSGVSFFIDRRQNTSCSIKIKNESNINARNEEDRKKLNLSLSKQISYIANKGDVENSLCYKYLKLLNEKKFTSLDVTV